LYQAYGAKYKNCAGSAFAPGATKKLSWAELKAMFVKHDVWYCPVNTPASVGHFPQARAFGIFEEVRRAIFNSQAKSSQNDALPIFLVLPMRMTDLGLLCFACF
jgi:hypothetical protein